MSEIPKPIKPRLSCCITMCRNYNNPYSNIDLYQLPSDSTQRRRFSALLGIPFVVAEQETARVCALHFKSKVLNSVNSRPEAAPIRAPLLTRLKEGAVSNLSNTVSLPIQPNFGFGQPINVFLQKPVSNTSSSALSPTSSILKSTNFISNSTSFTSNSTSSIKHSTSVRSTGFIANSTSSTASLTSATASLTSATASPTNATASPINATAIPASAPVNLASATVIPASSISSLTDNEMSKHTILNEILSSDRNVSFDEDSSDPENDDNDPHEKRTGIQLSMECDEELLSQSQLDSFYSDLASYLTANEIIRQLPLPVKTSTISTQTDPVTILCTEKIPPQSSLSVSGEEDSTLNSAQCLENGNSPIENSVVSLIKPRLSAIEMPTSAADNVGLNVTKFLTDERIKVLSPSLVPITSSSESAMLQGSSTPRISLSSLSSTAYHATTISPTTIPSSSVSTSVSISEKSRLFSALSQKTNSVKTPAPKFIVKPAPPYVPRGKAPLAVSHLLKNAYTKYRVDSNSTSQSQPRILTSISSAPTTAFTIANQLNQKTSSGLATLTTTTSSGVPLRKQVGLDPSLSAYQMGPQFQIISLNENQRIGNFPSFSNFTARDFNETPFQLLMPKPNPPNVIYSNNLPVQGSALTGFNTAPPLSIPIETESDTDKDADLLGLCNVATIYGSDTPPQSTTPVEQQNVLNPDSVGDVQQNLNFGSVMEKYFITDDTQNGSTPTEMNSPHISDLDSSQNSMGPLIVDVISATEGAKEYYIGDKIPNIFLSKKEVAGKKIKDAPDKNKKSLVYMHGNKVYKSGEKIPNICFKLNSLEGSVQSSKKTYGNDKEAASRDIHLLQKSDGPLSVVKIHNSVFSLQTSIPIIPNGFKNCLDARSLLELKVPIGKTGIDDANTLRQRLKAEKYIVCSVWWMVRRNYMPMAAPCSCASTSHSFTVNRSKKHPDGFCFRCTNSTCQREVPVRRPKFFESFKSYSLEELLILTYHWACQSPIEDIIMEIHMDPDKVLVYFQALQEVCHQILIKKCKLGLSADGMVEAALVKLGNFFVIGAFDRKTRYTRLDAITQLDAYSTTVHMQLLGNWLHKKAKLVTDKKIEDGYLKGIDKFSAISSITDHNNDKAHILNISKYLINNLTSIFGKVNQNHLSVEVVKGFLYELQWRGKYGKFLDMSFWSIMNHIRDLNDSQDFRVIAKPGDLNNDAFCKKMNSVLKRYWGPTTSEDIVTAVDKHVGHEHPAMSYSKAIALPAPNKPLRTWSKISNVGELFQDVPEIPGGSANINSKALLAIKIRCEDSTMIGSYKPNATSLGLHLRTEGFISEPVKWLVKRGYLSGYSPCYVCSGTSLLRENIKYKDGCSWSCQNEDCKFENMFRRPTFFARFNEQSMAQIAAMIFHWTVQSEYNIVTSDVPLDSVKLSHAWRAFQVLCSSALKRLNCKLGGDGQIVEVAIVQFGKLYILGAMHRHTKRTFLKCFPTEMNNQVELFHDTLRSWILLKTQVVVNSSPSFRVSKFYKIFVADTSITDRTSSGLHVLNITSYLLKHVFEMFGHLKADLIRPQLMQVYLDELMWRERFGKLPNLAFAKIMYEIFYHEKNKTSLLKEQSLTVKELLDEEPSIPKCHKEVCIILQRIPQTVLKYYNCLPTDSAAQKPPSGVPKVSDSDEDSYDSIANAIGEFSSSEDEVVSKIVQEPARSVQSKNKKKISSASKGSATLKDSSTSSESSSSEEEVSTASADSESSSSEDEELDELIRKKENSLLPNNKRKKISKDVNTGTSKVAKMVKLTKSKKGSKVVSTLTTDNAPAANSVQPLVIKMNKNRKKFQSYLKSEFLRAKYKRQRSRKFNVRRLPRRTPQKKTIPNDSCASTSGLVVKKEIIEEEPKASGVSQSVDSVSELPAGSKSVKRRSAMLRRLDTSESPACIECGKEAFYTHFMKQFSCTDCTKTVYTTCCGSAFFEHRSALLFGKRTPRRAKEPSRHGLHRSYTLPHTAACPCGFMSKIGNQIASHLVKCQQTSCFYKYGL